MIVRCVRKTPAPDTRDASWYESPSATMPDSCIRAENGTISVTYTSTITQYDP